MPLVRRLVVVALATTAVLAACHDRSADADGRHRQANVKFRARDSTRKLGPGDIQIQNSDNSIELALVGDSVVTGLGARVLDEVAAKTDTSAVKGDGFGAQIEKMVKNTVAGAMGHQLVFAVRDISDVRYDGGQLQFYNRDGSKMKLFENTTVNGKNAASTFTQDDAERFIAAFHARKATMTS